MTVGEDKRPRRLRLSGENTLYHPNSNIMLHGGGLTN
jgi:hypothetical protein